MKNMNLIDPRAGAEPLTVTTVHGGWQGRPNREFKSPDEGQSFDSWAEKEVAKQIGREALQRAGLVPLEDRTTPVTLHVRVSE